MSASTRRGLLAMLILAAAVGGVWAWWKFAPHTLPEALRARLPAVPEEAPALYRWRDDAGRVHVTDRPPEDGRPFETLRYHPDTNVVPSLDGRPRD